MRVQFVVLVLFGILKIRDLDVLKTLEYQPTDAKNERIIHAPGNPGSNLFCFLWAPPSMEVL